LPGASEPRLTELNPLGLQVGFSDCLRSQSNRSIVVVGNYGIGPITAEPCRAKARPLRPRRSCFDPIGREQSCLFRGIGGVAGYCPRVRKVYYDGHLSPYPACAGTKQYKRKRLPMKEHSLAPPRMSVAAPLVVPAAWRRALAPAGGHKRRPCGIRHRSRGNTSQRERDSLYVTQTGTYVRRCHRYIDKRRCYSR